MSAPGPHRSARALDASDPPARQRRREYAIPEAAEWKRQHAHPAAHAACGADRPGGSELLAMVQAYRTTGGLVCCDSAAMLLGRHHDQPISRLARWIVAREVVSFPWETGRLVPLFQFELADMSPRRRVTNVVAELADAFEDDLEVAAWFTRPNGWLRGALPLVMVEVDAEAVLQAARAQRYLARA